MLLECWDSGVASAADNMALDRTLIGQLETRQRPLLHTYQWHGTCATYGYFCRPDDWLDISAAVKMGVEFACRPTGGGITLHTNDLAFSFVLPAHHPAFSLNTLNNYAFVNRAVGIAVERWCQFNCKTDLLPVEAEPLSDSCRHFCMARPTQYDLVIAGRKVGGAAQRRTRYGYLHQGTILLHWPEEALWKSLVRDQVVWSSMQQHSYPIAQEVPHLELDDVRSELKKLLQIALNEELSRVLS
jgi:lipoate-protein ligase A